MADPISPPPGFTAALVFDDGVRVCERVIMADQMTFEEFRPYIQQKYSTVFAAGFALRSQVNPILDVR
jgi:hypothetical protein